VTCLIWRQHRGQALWTIITVAVLCLLAVNFGLGAEHWLAGYHSWLRQLAAAGCPPPTAHSGVFHVNSPATCLALKDRYPGSLQAAFVSHYNDVILLSQYGLPAAFAITGALIGAPWSPGKSSSAPTWPPGPSPCHDAAGTPPRPRPSRPAWR
jgi:hypothetical protein